jgi:hypothetical protein
MNDEANLSRRTWLRRAAAACGATAALALVPVRDASAQKASKEAMKYQDKPKDGQRCDGCVYFQAPRACGIVEGDIAPEGWCVAWNKKP